MKKWDLLAEVTTPDGSQMTFHTNGDDKVIRVNGRELMSTRHHFSEEQLAVTACRPLKAHKQMRVLIGGLGLGFTLRAALAELGADAQVIVAELMPEVLAWNKDPKLELAYDCLADKRTTVVLIDVAKLIAQEQNGFNAIMLDTDNGTTAMSSGDNNALYSAKGLQLVKAALRPGGKVIYWSAGNDPIFAKLMGKCGFKVSIERPRIHENSGGRHFLLIGQK
jgi:spermidine synthase